MSAEMEQPVTVVHGGRQVGLSEKTGSPKSESYLGTATGEGVWANQVVVDRTPTIALRPPAKRNGNPAKTLPTAGARHAFRSHWNKAQAAAEAMLQAAKAKDLMDVGVAADQLDQSLSELWNLRDGRDIDWQTILNHMQGMMRVFFLEKRAETLTAEQCKRIVDLVKDYLGPATKTVDDLNEVLRLIDDAGFDPFAAISGDPVSDEQE